MKYKVKNLSKDERKFRDRNGQDVLVEPGKSVITTSPPEDNDIWEVKIHTEKTEEIKPTKEVISKKMETKKEKMLSDR